MNDKIGNEIVKVAGSIVDNILNSNDGGENMFDSLFERKRTSFAKLIESQQRQISVISEAYEDELKDLQRKIDELEAKIFNLSEESKALEEKLKRKDSPKKEKKVKEAEDVSESKASQ